MESRTRTLAGLGIVALTAAVGVVLWPRLPETVATHWNGSGEVNGTMPRLVAVVAMPALALLLLGTFEVLPRIDPLGENFQRFRWAYDLLAVTTVGFVGYVHVVVLLWNVGYEFTIMQALAPAMAALYYVIGIVTGRAERNWFVGIRTPWTLSNETVWRRTHDRAATLFKAAAIVALVGVAVPELATWFVVAPVVAVAAYATLYSFWAYRNVTGGGA